MTIKNTLFLILLSIFANAMAVEPQDLLPAEEAYRLSVESISNDRILARWDIADGYYMYRKRFKFNSGTDGIDLGEPKFPKGKIKEDEFFGRMETYRHQVAIEIPLSRSTGSDSQLALKTSSQGCADAGVCYLPQKEVVEIDLPVIKVAQVKQARNLDEALQNLKQDFSPSGIQEFLPVDEAYQLTVEMQANNVARIHWNIADEYYMYRDKFSVRSLTDGVTLGDYQMRRGKIKNDEFFGEMEVLYKEAEILVPVVASSTDLKLVELEISYQGCAEAGLCYPPQKRTIALSLDTSGSPAGLNSTPTSSNQNTPFTEQDKLAAFLLEKPLWLSAGLFFLIGIGLTFTPCVLPMIPIISGIVVGQGDKITTGGAFRLSLIYVMAMALTYTIAGIVVALAGANLQVMFQNPWVLGSFAGVFVLLSLSMFGFYELQMPSSLQSKLAEISNNQRGGTYIGAGVMGFLSALIVGPCITAPLIAALLVIGQTGDPVLGGTALFAMSMGMGIPLLVVGTSAGKLLPKAGQWMDAVKSVFGVLLLGVAIWMLERVIPATATMTLWAMLLIVSAVYMGALSGLSADASGWQKLRKGLGLIMILYGSMLLVGAGSGATDPFKPLSKIGFVQSGGTGSEELHLTFKRIKSLDDLQREVALANSQGKAVMLDFYADWCISCKEMERFTFSDSKVQARLSALILLQADVTANDKIDQALMKKFNLFGPPAILFFDRSGKEQQNHRMMGFLDAADFLSHLDRTPI